MHPETFKRLRSIGLTPALWQSLLAGAATDGGGPPSAPARVITVHRETTVLHDGAAQFSARPCAELAGTALAVGDWVRYERDTHGAPWIKVRAEPRSQLVRRDADGLRHVLVSNVDVAFIVMGLDGDYNPRRAERFIALVRAAGSDLQPVIVLTKRDWVGEAVAQDDGDALRRRLGPDTPVEAVNALAPASAGCLARYIGAAQTAVLLGSSGAGKSTLTNALVGTIVEDTGAVRAADSRGKHTTTHRALYPLPGGGCVIDTPGIRTLRPDLDADALDASFADIGALAVQCRFRDCRHQQEPGCAVRAAVDADRLANWHKLGRELRRDSMSALERQRQVAVWKARSRGARERMRMKRGE